MHNRYCWRLAVPLFLSYMVRKKHKEGSWYMAYMICLLYVIVGKETATNSACMLPGQMIHLKALMHDDLHLFH